MIQDRVNCKRLRKTLLFCKQTGQVSPVSSENCGKSGGWPGGSLRVSEIAVISCSSLSHVDSHFCSHCPFGCRFNAVPISEWAWVCKTTTALEARKGWPLQTHYRRGGDEWSRLTGKVGEGAGTCSGRSSVWCWHYWVTRDRSQAIRRFAKNPHDRYLFWNGMRTELQFDACRLGVFSVKLVSNCQLAVLREPQSMG